MTVQGLGIDVTLDAHAAISYHHRGAKKCKFQFFWASLR